MNEPDLPDYIDGNGRRHGAELIYRVVDYRMPSDTSIGVFDRDEPENVGSAIDRRNARYLGFVDSRVASAKWDFRRLSANDYKSVRDALDGCVVVLGAGAVSTHHGYDTLYVRQCLTEFRLKWVSLSEEWQGMEPLIATLRDLRKRTFQV